MNNKELPIVVVSNAFSTNIEDAISQAGWNYNITIMAMQEKSSTLLWDLFRSVTLIDINTMDLANKAFDIVINGSVYRVAEGALKLTGRNTNTFAIVLKNTIKLDMQKETK